MSQHTPTDPIPALPPPPAWARWGAVLGGVALGLSVLPALWLTTLGGEAVLWFSTAFETLVLSVAVIALLAGFGRFRDGWGLSLACVAGTVLVCAVFAFVEVRANFNDDPNVAGWLKPYLAFRLGMACYFGAWGSLAVFSRNPASFRTLAKAMALLAPAVGLLGWVVVRGVPGANATSASPGAEAARILALCLGGLIVIGLLSVGGHLVIRAYDLGRAPGERPGDA